MDPKVTLFLAGDLDITAATFTDADLRGLHAAIAETFAAVDPGEDAVPTDEQLTEMRRLTEAGDRVASEVGARTATQRATTAGELRGRLAPLPEPAAPEAPAVPAQSTADGGEGAGEVVETREPELVTAAATVPPVATTTPTLAQLAQRANPTPPATTRPRRIKAEATLTAAANVPNVSFGAPVSWEQLARSTREKLRQLGAATTQEKHIVASLAWEYPEERRLGDDAWLNTERMDRALNVDAVMSSVEEQGGMEAVVAAGGVCGPLPVDYAVDVTVSEARPLRDSLPSFQATRGGLRYIPVPTLAGVGTSATAVWTSANDASPSSPTAKPVQEFSCPTPTEVTVDAIPTRLQFSNFSARFGPEIVAANTMLAMANAARIAEVNLLTKMAAGSIKTSAGSLVSFTRDLLALLDLLATNYRYRHRLPENYPLRLVLPFWVKAVIRTDFLRETAHDRSNASSDQLAVADAYIAGLFAARYIVPGWTMDGLGKSTAGATLSAADAWDYPDQTFAAPATTAALSAALPDASANSAVAGTHYPKRLTFFLFAEGTWVFLDGGRIDLGVIRDSVLNATNKYQTFVEPFEGLMKRGIESLQVTVPVNPTGVSVATASAPAVSALVY